MPDTHRLISLVLVILCTSAVSPGKPVLEYPVRLLDVHDADGSCWYGIDPDGTWQSSGSQIGVPVVPQEWLVGPPPSELSAVTIPEDHWVNLAFSGQIANDPGSDLIILEAGMMGEQALVFLTDGKDQEYVVGLAEADWTNRQDMSRIEIDLSNNPAPFVARGVRIVGVDFGGGSPGFDLASIQARVSRDCGTGVRYPNPVSGAVGIEPNVRLSWTPACSSAAQRVYCSRLESQVRSAAPGALVATLPPDANSFRPRTELGGTYYWRVDAVSPAGAAVVYPGDVWSFTVRDHTAVEDFESYLDDESLQDAWESWSWSSVYLGAADAQVCDVVMDFRYSCDASVWPYVVRQFDAPQDWTQAGAKLLQITLRGDMPDTAGGEIYFGVTDGVSGQIVPYGKPTEAGADNGWRTWRIALADFSGIDLTQVRAMAIGVRPALDPTEFLCQGVLSVADISLYPALCVEGLRPGADLDGDCAVNPRDLERMAADWLRTRVRSLPIAEPNMPVLWYTFDGHANDRAGNAHGQVQGRATYVPGVYGQAIRLTDQGDLVNVPKAAAVFAGIRDAITITFWQHGDDSSHLNDTVCCSNYQYGKSNPAVAVHLGCWENPGQYRWDCGYPWSIDNRLAGRHGDKKEWSGRWNHWAFTKDIRPGPNGEKGRMAIYLNGELYDSRTGTTSPITNVTSFEIGSGWYGRYDGLIDEFRIYDYALSPAEVAWVATNSTGTIEDTVASPADLDASDRVDFRDFAILATQWLEDALWP